MLIMFYFGCRKLILKSLIDSSGKLLLSVNINFEEIFFLTGNLIQFYMIFYNSVFMVLC